MHLWQLAVDVTHDCRAPGAVPVPDAKVDFSRVHGSGVLPHGSAIIKLRIIMWCVTVNVPRDCAADGVAVLRISAITVDPDEGTEQVVLAVAGDKLFLWQILRLEDDVVV